MVILAIDGNSIMNRAFYGIRMLSNKQGVFTNAVTGFMNIYLKVINDIKPDAVAVAFDLRAPTFRHEKTQSYKANRKGMPDELAMQMPLIKEILAGLSVKVVEAKGYEADDILGTLSKMCENSSDEGDKCYILTGDKDSLQLLSGKTTVLLHTTKELKAYSPELFTQEYGFAPVNLIDLKALMGDSSDNISGVKGIGERTAMALISEYSTIEEIYAALENGSLNVTKSVSEKLRTGKEDAELSKWLATIVTNVPLEAVSGLDSFALKEHDIERLSAVLTGLEMFKLLEKLKVKPSENPAVLTAPSLSVVPEKRTVLPRLNYSVGVLTELIFDEIVNTKSIITFYYTNVNLNIVYNSNIYTISNKEQQLKFLSSNCPKYTFAAKPAYHFCFENNTELVNIKADAEILGYLLNTSSSEYTINRMCAEYNSPYYDLGEYSDTASLPQLCERLLGEVEKAGMLSLYYDIEQPLTEVLASMEHFGFTLDVQGLKDFGERLVSDINALEQQIHFMAGHDFNIASPKQLGVVLFEELGLPSGKKTKTGWSTNAEVLEGLKSKHDIIELILQYRKLTKLNSTYVEGFLKLISEDGRVHTVFKQTETKTGRISSAEPNMQNIPVRTELGRSMRKFFTAKKGCILLDADYSQIELRILAHMSGDNNMQNNFHSGMDIHASTAAQVFKMPPDMVTSEMRRAAKAVNFGIIYGIGAFSLSSDIGVTVKQADSYIKNYLDGYPGVKKFMDETIAQASKTGYAVTMLGRRRNIPELSSSNKNIQAFGKRAAMNAPIQGTAADIIKIAMVKVYRRLKEECPNAKLILQVHDELIIEAPAADTQKAALILGEEMRNAVALDVPLAADVSSGGTWYEAKMGGD
ncbi:MAG: DNA polymerase I [Oscillospiraceae bacterium]|nr:DNA polymerase I [Oscillospiraceae bacterium]